MKSCDNLPAGPVRPQS